MQRWEVTDAVLLSPAMQAPRAGYDGRARWGCGAGRPGRAHLPAAAGGPPGAAAAAAACSRGPDGWAGRRRSWRGCGAGTRRPTRPRRHAGETCKPAGGTGHVPGLRSSPLGGALRSCRLPADLLMNTAPQIAQGAASDRTSFLYSYRARARSIRGTSPPPFSRFGGPRWGSPPGRCWCDGRAPPLRMTGARARDSPPAARARAGS